MARLTTQVYLAALAPLTSRSSIRAAVAIVMERGRQTGGRGSGGGWAGGRDGGGVRGTGGGGAADERHAENRGVSRGLSVLGCTLPANAGGCCWPAPTSNQTHRRSIKLRSRAAPATVNCTWH